MKNFDYEITKQTVENTPAYGLRVLSGETVVREYKIVSCIKSHAMRLKELLEAGDISEQHHNDVVENYLYGLYDDVLRQNGLR